MDETKKDEIMKIMEQEKMNFRKILPKKQAMFLPQYNYLPNAHIIEMVEQFDIFIQLLIQNYLFCPVKEKQMEILNLIDKINLQKNQFIFLNDLRKYDVYLVDMKYGNNSLNTIRHYLLSKFEKIRHTSEGIDFSILNFEEGHTPSIQESLSFQLSPQISVMQCPTLETLSLVIQAVQKQLDTERKLSLLKELAPFVRKSYIPTFLDGAQPVAKPLPTQKFTNADDLLLLNGLVKFGSKNMNIIQKIYLPHKSAEEIKNRFKNLTRFKSQKNIVKNWKISEIAPLTEIERINLEKGKIWFGDKNYLLISKYFLPSRDPQFLELNDLNDAKLLAKRSLKYFEYPEENVDSVLIDSVYDLYTQNDQVNKNNIEFMKFLRRLYSQGLPDPKLISKDAKDFENTYLTIKLSEQQLAFTNNSNHQKNFLVFNKDSAINSKVQFVDDKIILNNNKLPLGKANAKHKIITDDLKRIKTDTYDELAPKRLCPTVKELEKIAKYVHKKMDFTSSNKEFYKKLYFN